MVPRQPYVSGATLAARGLWLGASLLGELLARANLSNSPAKLRSFHRQPFAGYRNDAALAISNHVSRWQRLPTDAPHGRFSCEARGPTALKPLSDMFWENNLGHDTLLYAAKARAIERRRFGLPPGGCRGG